MVKVKNGKKSDSKIYATKVYDPNLVLKEYKGMMLSHSIASKIESGKFLILLTAVARQCTMYRTVLLSSPPTEKSANKRLDKWCKTLPVKFIK